MSMLLPSRRSRVAGAARWALTCLIAGAASLHAVDLTQPVDVPDDIGLGERLALVAWLGEQKIPVKDPQDLPALRLAYLKRAHPERLVDPAALKPADERQRGELAAALYRKHGINPPAGADVAAITALMARLDSQSDAALARDQDKARADGAAVAADPVPPPTADGEKPRATPAPPTTAKLPAMPPSAQNPERDAAFAAVGIVIGKPFPAFAGRTVDGSAFSLDQWRGKVVLIDFWATWCGPCIREMPNVKAAYEAHHAQGLEVIGVSLDQDKATLVKGIAAMGLSWPHLFDGGAWETRLAKQCAVRSIPATFLIGKDGVLLATNLRGESLAAGVTAALAMGR